MNKDTLGKLLVRNMQPLTIWALAFTAGFCLGGVIGIGVVALILLIIQIVL